MENLQLFSLPLRIEAKEISETEAVTELPPSTTQEPLPEEAPTPEETVAPQPSTPLVSTPAPSEVNQIVILLPADDGDSSGGSGTDGEDRGVPRETTSWETTDTRLQESLVYCEETPFSSFSSSCQASVQEHLLQQCSALLALHRRRKKTTEKPLDASTSSSSSDPVSPISPSQHEDVKSTGDLSLSPSEDSLLPEQPPPVSLNQHAADVTPDLAPSLTPSLSETFSSDPPSHQATPSIDLSESSVSGAEAAGSKETEILSQKTPVPSSTDSSPPTAATTTTTTTSNAREDASSSGEETTTTEPTEVEQPGAVDPKASLPTSSDSAVPEQTDSAPAQPSSLTEPPAHPGPEERTGASEEPPSPASPAEASDGLMPTGEPRLEDLLDETILGGPATSTGQLPLPSSSASAVSGSPSSSSSSSLEMLSEMVNASEAAGGTSGQGHGSGQKESVFMRLNNRIKALEMNMSLSGRYLEQLSQRCVSLFTHMICNMHTLGHARLAATYSHSHIILSYVFNLFIGL